MMRRNGSSPFFGRPIRGLAWNSMSTPPGPSRAWQGLQVPTRCAYPVPPEREPDGGRKSNPPAPANHDAMSTCLFATVT